MHKKELYNEVEDGFPFFSLFVSILFFLSPPSPFPHKMKMRERERKLFFSFTIKNEKKKKKFIIELLIYDGRW